MPSTNSGSSSPATQAGISTSESGDRVIASSKRADGTLRKEIRVRPGYRPPEDVELYKNRTAEAFKSRGKGGVPGARFVEPPKSKPSKTKAEKKRDQEPVANSGEGKESNNGIENLPPTLETISPSGPVDPEAEKEKEAKKLCKKLRQARDLQQKKEGGAALLPEQFQKVIQMNELIRQLDTLGFDSEGQKKM